MSYDYYTHVYKGTEAGGGSGFSTMRICTGGQSQPQVDPKQQQQPVQGGIPMSYAQQTRPTAQLFPRPATRLNTPRPHIMGQAIPNANLQYSQTMIIPPPYHPPQTVIIPHGASIQSGRHQSHGGGQGAGTQGGHSAAAFYHSQQPIYTMPSPHPIQTAYTQYPAPYMYQMRNNSYQPQNAGPHPGAAAPQPPQHQSQQQFVVESSGVRGGGGGGGGGGSQMMPPLHQPQQPAQAQPRLRRSHAIAIVNPISGKDITDEIYSETNSGESTASATPHSIPHSERAVDAVVAAEFAAKVAAAVAPEAAVPSAEVAMQPSLAGVVNGPSGGSNAGSPPPPPSAPTPPVAVSELPPPPSSRSTTPSSPLQQHPPHLQQQTPPHHQPQPPIPHLQPQPPPPHLQQQPPLPHLQPQPPPPHIQQQPLPPHIQQQTPHLQQPPHIQQHPPHIQPQPPHMQQHPPHLQPQPPHHQPQPPHHQPQPPHHQPQPPHHQPQPPHHQPQPPHHQPQPPHLQPQPQQPHLQQQPTPAPPQPQIPTVSAKTDSPPVELPRPKALTHSPGRKPTPIPSSVQPVLDSKKKEKKLTGQVVASLPPHKEEPEERKSSFADSINIKNLQPVPPVQLPPPQAPPAAPAPEPETNGEPEVVVPPPVTQPKIQEQPPHQPSSHDRGKPLGKKSGKGKKGGGLKEQSRRWQEKEGGSEMDAFVTPGGAAPSPPPPAATSEPEPAATTAAPASVASPLPPPPQQAPVLPPPAPTPVAAPEVAPERQEPSPPPQPQREPTPSPPPQPSNNINTQNEDEVEEMDEGEEIDVEAIIVAVKNEENNKVSAVVDEGEETILNDDTTDKKPSLKYTYKEGQWSPLNPDGKKVYDRDFLLTLRLDDLSTKRPDIEDCDIIKTDSTNNNSISANNNNNRRPMHSSNSLSMNRGDGFVPVFLRSSSSQRGGGMIGKRGSQQGQRPNRDGRGRSMFPSQQYLGSDSELHWASKGGGWKPDRCKTPPKASEDEIKTENLYKKIRGILNKLTPEMFNKLMDQILELPIDTIERMTGVVELVFDKAVDEPSFSVAYAKLCQNLNKLSIKIADNEKDRGTGAEVSFRKILLTRCQHMFEKKKKEEKGEEGKKSEDERIAELQQQLAEQTTRDKKREYQLILEEEERKIRVKYVGLARFIGELFKLNMLTSKIMFGCISTLFEKIEEESLECLCKLLTTVGKELEQQIKETPLMKELDECFTRMRNLSRKTAHSKVSSRVRFMLQDVIELRGNKWVPRREDNNPKTMDQIQREAERETMMESANLMQASNTPRNKHSDRGDDRRRGGPRSGGGGNVDSDGWISTNKFRSYTFEASKLQHLKGTESEPSSQNLGSYGQFKQWGFGSSAGPKLQQQQQQQQQQSTNNERRGFDYNTQNKFALLGDEKKMPPMMSRKTGPSSSQEKERALQSVRDVITPDKSSRNQSSNPPSRDSSRARSSAKPTPVATPTPAPEKELPLPQEQVESEDPEIIRMKSWVLFEEWLANHNIQESADSISEACPDVSVFVNSVMGRVVEGKESQRVAFGELLAHLTTKGIVPAAVVSKELGELLEFGEDLMIDLPFIWKYLGELIVPILAKGAFTFADLKSACENFRTRHLTVTLTEIINRLLKEKGPVFIKTQWETSQVNFSDFIPEVDVDEFIKKNNFGFIIGEGEVETKDAVTSMSEVEKILFNFLVQDGDKVSDHVCEWVKANVGSKSQDVDFIKALMRAVIKACIKNGKIVPSSLHKNSTLIKKFIDTNETRELACLSGILHLVVIEMESPAGLLVEIFQTLNDHNIISYEAFLKWKSHGNNEPGKGVAMASLSSFYVSLSEQDDSDEDST